MKDYMKENNYPKKAKYLKILILVIFWTLYSFSFSYFGYKVSIIFSMIYLIIFLYEKNEVKYYLILFSLPFAGIFKISNASPSILIILYIIFIISNLGNIKLKFIQVFSLIILSILQVFSIFLFDASFMNISSFLLNIFFMMFCISFLNQSKKKKEILEFSIKIYNIALIASILLADIFPKIPYIISENKQILLATINRFSGMNADPNYYSQLVLIGIALLVYLLKRGSKKNYMVYFTILFLIINGLRSRSKSFVLTLVVLLIYIFCYELIKCFKSKKVKIFKLYKTFFVFIVGIYIFCINVVIPLINSRTDTKDFFSGREGIWSNYLIVIEKNPLAVFLGAGFSNEAQLLMKMTGEFKAAHNVYLEMILGIGILGILCLIFILSDLTFNFLKILKSPILLYWVVWGVTGLGLSLSSNDAIYILIPLSILISEGGDKN